MSLFERMAEILRAKTHKLLSHLEDPNELLDLSYEKMIAGLQETKRHLADVFAEQKSLERQIEETDQEIVKSEDNARLALQSDREDLARRSLEAKQSALQKRDTLQHALATIVPQVTKLSDYQTKLEDRIEQFHTQKEVMKSSYAAAQAQVKVTESLTGIGQNLGNVGDTMRRAGEKVSDMRSKADALDGLVEAGILSDPLDHRTSVEKELTALKSNNAVDDELAKLKAEMVLRALPPK